MIAISLLPPLTAQPRGGTASPPAQKRAPAELSDVAMRFEPPHIMTKYYRPAAAEGVCRFDQR